MQEIRQFSPTSRLHWAVLAWSGWWLLALWPLAGHWSTNPQYAYGWLVPPLALLLAWRRWRTRPAPEPSAPRAGLVIAVAAAAVLPAWLIAQPNPGWRLVPSLLAVSAVVGTLALCALLGGRSWARHFAFPICFTLTAVPWPSVIEEPLIQGLMRFVAGVTVALLNFAGLPAVQQGNLVEVATGVLGVDEACSGVRSLQAALMAALFLGELHRLKPGARLALAGAGFLAAVLTNIGRTSFLSYSAAQHGLSAVSQWHDPAGYSVLTICLVLIALLAEWLRGRHTTPATPPTTQPANVLPSRLGLRLVAWFAGVFLGTEMWYHRPSVADTPTWTLALPPGAKEEPLPERTLDLLGCDHTRAAHWRDASGAQWTLFFLEWLPRRSRTALLAQVHRPEVCLPGTGLVETGPRRTVSVSAAGFDLAFSSMHFRDPRGHDAYVFYCPWENVPGQPGRNAAFSDATRTASLRRVWQRERVLGQQVAELIVTGVASRDAAESALRALLEAQVQRITPRGG
jgi:exosortase